MNYKDYAASTPFLLGSSMSPCHPVSLEILPSRGTPRSEIILEYAHDILFSL